MPLKVLSENTCFTRGNITDFIEVFRWNVLFEAFTWVPSIVVYNCSHLQPKPSVTVCMLDNFAQKCTYIRGAMKTVLEPGEL